MKKCQGTFSYVFSPQDLQVLEGLNLYSKLQSDTDSMLVRNFWISSNGIPFCLQYREIVNEEALLPQQQMRALDRLMPGLLKASEITPPSPLPLSQELQLCGIVVEDLPTTRAPMTDWELPFPITWSQPTADELSHRFSYRKAFPFWALLLSCSSLSSLPQSPFSQAVQWKEQRALWIPMETTTWDLLICERT